MKRRFTLIIVGFFLGYKALFSQNTTRFGGGIVAGFNASQLEGDNSAGYNLKGLTGGLRAVTYLNDRFKVTLDMLYSQRGAVTSETETLKERSCRLEYLEVPVQIHLCDWIQTAQSGKKYAKVSLGGGVCYSRLFKTTTNENFTHTLAVNDFSKNDFALTGSANFNVTELWGFTFRYTTSLNTIFDKTDFPNTVAYNQLQPLRGYFLTLQSFVVF